MTTTLDPAALDLTTARFRRGVAAGCLLATAVLSAISVLLQPDFGGSASERLAAIDEAGDAAGISAACFVLAQLPFLGAVLGIGHLLRARAPRLANVAPAVAVVGGFGHAVFGGAMLLTVTMAGAPGGRARYADALDRFESSPAMAFAAMGLLGTVLGVLLLAAGLWRAKAGPRWVPAGLVAFVVVEFAGTALTTWASPLAAAIYLASFTALAVTVWQSPELGWVTGRGSETDRGMVHTDS